MLTRATAAAPAIPPRQGHTEAALLNIPALLASYFCWPLLWR
jgi:hypothetical protein